jgi:hypothetical protein
MQRRIVLLSVMVIVIAALVAVVHAGWNGSGVESEARMGSSDGSNASGWNGATPTRPQPTPTAPPPSPTQPLPTPTAPTPTPTQPPT